MNLHREFGVADIAGNLFVDATVTWIMIFGSRELNVSNALRAHLAKSCSLGYGLDRVRDLGSRKDQQCCRPGHAVHQLHRQRPPAASRQLYQQAG